MLKRGLLLREVRQCCSELLSLSLSIIQAIDAWTFETESLRGLGLSKLDWKLLEQLKDCLEVCLLALQRLSVLILIFLQLFTQATLQLSHENQATLPFALPLYLKLENHLRSTIGDRVNNHIKVRHGAQAGLAKLLKYRAYADENQYYKVATGTLLSPTALSESNVLQLFTPVSAANGSENSATQKPNKIIWYYR